MARTNKQRVDGAIEYLAKNIDPELSVQAATQLAKRSVDDVGAELSLTGHGMWRKGSDAQHWAMRALLACHKAFLKAPYAIGAGGKPFDYNSQPDLPKTFFASKSEEEICTAIRSYVKLGTPADLAAVATEIQNPRGSMTWETMTRTTSPFPGMPVCFDGLKMWLFKAGFISLRWLANTGPKMTAQTVNSMLGQGKIIPESQLNQIPKGHLFNFHRANDQAVCHWGVSLGGGWGAASNTTADWAKAKAPVNFRSGNSFYGEFTLQTSLDVCKAKYALTSEDAAEITIRQIDPSLVSTYF
jgi:hypothetical protein